MIDPSPTLSDHAWQIIQAAVPQAHRATGCLYFAMAAASALGTGWHFRAGGAMLGSSGMTGWGLSVSPRDQTYYVTASQAVDPDDGTYCGHCWVQSGTRAFQPIVDIHEGYYGPRLQPEKFIVYHALPTLTRSIKQHHAVKLAAIARRARRDTAFVTAIQAVAQQAQEAVWAVLS